MRRKQKPQRSKWGIDAHRKCKVVKKRLTERFFDENERIFEDYRQGRIY